MNRGMSTVAGRVGSMGAALVVALGMAATVGLSHAAQPSARGGRTAAPVPVGPDLIVLRSGAEVRGTIVEETETAIGMRPIFGGIESLSVVWYNKTEILRMERGEAPAAEPAVTVRPGTPGQPGTEPAQPAEGATRVYHMRLKGQFARDISETPILQALEDAARQNAQVIVVEIDNEWRANQFQTKAEDEHAFDEFWRTEAMRPLFTDRLAQLFPQGRPRLVMWVKNAMGGAAFLPFVSREIYFAPEGRMGGIGDLDQYFQGTNEWFKDKQQSLRLAAARGLAIAGGYDQRLIDAMVLREYVLSVGFDTGSPVYYEGTPRPERNEELLTDDGEGPNKDTDAQVVRAQGNDNLTLHARMAEKLRVSRGTAATLDELLFVMGVGRNYALVSERANRIMDDWSNGIENGIRTFLRMRDQELPQARQAEGGGNWEDRNRARGRQQAIIRDMIRMLNRYGEVLDPNEGMRAQLELELEAIRLRSIADRR